MPKQVSHNSESTSAEVQVAGFIAKFEPEIAKLVRSARSEIRKRYPQAIELVYDNYNALAIGYSPSEKTSEVIFSLAVYPRWVSLYFMHGRSLPDPGGLLEGSGNQGGFVRLDSLAILNQPAVKTLLNHAINNAKTKFSKSGGGYTIIKSISVKQRPRRPVKSIRQ